MNSPLTPRQERVLQHHHGLSQIANWSINADIKHPVLHMTTALTGG